jgi:putative ABC transport system permease protein
MLRWCDLLIRAAAPLVPYDIRANWMREWRAELAYACGRAGKRGQRVPLACLWRTSGVFFHAAWLRWDRWRIEMIIQDFRHALRALRAKPGFTAVTVLTLAVGIGGNAAIFGAVNAVLLRPLPYPDADSIVRVFKTSIKQPDGVGGTASPPDFTDWRRDNAVFTEMSGVLEGSYALTGEGTAEQVPGASVTGGFFTVMGVPALHGRTLRTDDDAIGGPDVVVLSHGVWTRRFGGDAGAIGRRVMLEGVSHEVVGIMPAGFNFPLQSQLWKPIRFTAKDLETQRGAHYVDVVGRIKPGITVEQARANMRTIAARLAEQFPSTNRNSSASVHPLRDAVVGSVRQSMFVLLGAVGLVLLMVCVNVAGLVLVRAVGRGRELAVRMAVGAGRFTLIRGLLVESLVLGIAGGIGGLVLASWATTAIASLDVSVGVPMLDQTRLDVTVVGFTLVVSVLAAVLFGTMPAWHASSIPDVAGRIREEGGSTSADPRRQRMRSALIVAETMLAVVLLVGAGLLARSFSKLLSVDLGIDPAGIQTFSLSLPEARYATPIVRDEFMRELLRRVNTLPAVESAAAAFDIPMASFNYGITVSALDGRRLSDEEQDRMTLQVRVVTPELFAAFGIPVLRGRAFGDGDRIGAEAVAILSESAAARLFAGADPMGRQVTLGTRLGQGGIAAGGSVVGIVRDVHDRGPALPARPTIYVAHSQFPVDFFSVAVKTRGEPSALVEPLRNILADLNADLPMFRVRTLDQIIATRMAQPRLYTVLIGCFALTAVLLAAIGLYGVLAYAVGQRTREIGIRLALGAKRGEVLRMVMSQAGKLVIAGVAIGLVAAVLASRLLRAQLFEVAPTDTVTYLLVAMGLLIVSLLASWIPARRASRIDPMTALRQD